MSTEDGIIYMISRSLKIFVSKVFFINMSEDKVAAYSETWLDVSIAYGCMRGLKKRSLKFGVVLNCQRSF